MTVSVSKVVFVFVFVTSIVDVVSIVLVVKHEAVTTTVTGGRVTVTVTVGFGVRPAAARLQSVARPRNVKSCMVVDSLNGGELQVDQTDSTGEGLQIDQRDLAGGELQVDQREETTEGTERRDAQILVSPPCHRWQPPLINNLSARFHCPLRHAYTTKSDSYGYELQNGIDAPSLAGASLRSSPFGVLSSNA